MPEHLILVRKRVVLLRTDSPHVGQVRLVGDERLRGAGELAGQPPGHDAGLPARVARCAAHHERKLLVLESGLDQRVPILQVLEALRSRSARSEAPRAGQAAGAHAGAGARGRERRLRGLEGAGALPRESLDWRRLCMRLTCWLVTS